MHEISPFGFPPGEDNLVTFSPELAGKRATLIVSWGERPPLPDPLRAMPSPYARIRYMSFLLTSPYPQEIVDFANTLGDAAYGKAPDKAISSLVDALPLSLLHDFRTNDNLICPATFTNDLHGNYTLGFYKRGEPLLLEQPFSLGLAAPSNLPTDKTPKTFQQMQNFLKRSGHALDPTLPHPLTNELWPLKMALRPAAYL